MVDSIKCTKHMPVLVHLLPLSTILPLYHDVAESFVRDTLHLALHSFKTDRREYFSSPGMMCPSLAFLGS